MSRSARAGLVVAVGLTVLFLILATLAQTGPLPGEGALAQTFVDHRNAILDAASRLASLPVWTVFVLLVSAGVWRWRGQTAALLVVGAAVSAESVSLLAKILVAARARSTPSPMTR